MMFSRRRSTKRVSVLATAATAILVLAAVVANAAQAAEWQIEGTSLQTRSLSSETISGSIGETVFSLKSMVGEVPVAMSCSSTAETGSIAQRGKGTNTITLTGCAVEKPKHCTISSIVLTARSALEEINRETYDVLEPASGGSLGMIEVRGGTCAVAGNFSVKGSLAGGFVNFNEAESRSLSFSPTISSAAGAGLTFGGVPAEVTGSIVQRLSGSNAGRPWSPVHYVGPRSGYWINGTPLVGSESIGSSSSSVGLSWKWGETPIGVACSGSESSGTLNGSGTSGEALTLTGCDLTGGFSGPCGIANGTIPFNPLASALEHAGSAVYKKYSPASGSELTTVSVVGGTCAISGNYPIKGKFIGSASTAHSAVDQPFALASNGELTMGGEPVSISGSLTQHLAGINLGERWEVN